MTAVVVTERFTLPYLYGNFGLAVVSFFTAMNWNYLIFYRISLRKVLQPGCGNQQNQTTA